MTGLYGLRKGSNVIIEPEYELGIYGPIWVHDMLVLTHVKSPDKKKRNVLFDANGNIIFSRQNENLSIQYRKSCLFYYSSSDIKADCGVIDLKGKEIIELKGCNVYEIYPGWLANYDDNNSWVYSIKSNKRYSTESAIVTGDVIKLYYQKKYYVLNPVTEKIFGPYDRVGDFNEGLVMVTRGDKYIFLSKDGVEYPLPTGWSVSDDGFSEGVCSALDNNSLGGYIYNPLGTSYVYNQKNVNTDRYTISRLIESGLDAAKRNENGLAKDLFYKVMMADPTNIIAINNYSCSLYNLGYYDEALAANQCALDLDESDDYAVTFRPKILAAIERRDGAAYEEEFADVTSGTSFWDALSAFGQALSNISSGYGGSSYGNGTNYGSSGTSRNVSA